MPRRIDVELDIFSGNPNPTWTLSDADADVFLQKLAGLPKAARAELSTNLGYRGMIVHVTDGPESSVVDIQSGTVRISRAASSVYFADPNRNLERWLLAAGKGSLTSDVYQIVEAELAK